jgi:hypothetical protein
VTASAFDTESAVISFEAFGVSLSVATNRREVLDRIPEVLPPDWRPCSEADVEHRLAITGDERGTYAVDLGGVFVLQGVFLDIALDHLDSVLRTRIALNAPGRTFVRAGVVGLDSGTVLLPGGSFTGKTTLVGALVRAGAAYYSDEFAVLDDDGLVYPYPNDPESLGGTAGDQPLPIRAVITTTYRPGAEWAPRALSTSDGALALLGNAVTALYRPAEAMQVITNAVEGAVLLEGDRGEAEQLAPLLLAELEARAT